LAGEIVRFFYSRAKDNSAFATEDLCHLGRPPWYTAENVVELKDGRERIYQETAAK
jgi:hypothetical protein